MTARETLQYDIVIVGAGPAGLSAAIRLKQLASKNNCELSVCVIEKAAELGAHILSGTVFDPRALNELFPDWKNKDVPITIAVSDEEFLFLTETKAYKTPYWLLPKSMKNKGNYVISLAKLVRWLGNEAQALNVDIFPGFAAAKILYDENESVIGVVTGDMGVSKDGRKKSNFQLGIKLLARYTLFAEGTRGHLGKQLIKRFSLDKGKDPQSYSIGLKEIWQIKSLNSRPGKVVHTAGWPLNKQAYGGSFIYHLNNNQLIIGLMIGLAYENPYLSPFDEFQKFKTHPYIRKILDGGKRVAYGARATTTGGLQSLPELVFPGGALIGCEAGFVNASRMKGGHLAMKSGMLAAKAAFYALLQGREKDTLTSYQNAFYQSWLHEELHKSRNFKPWMKRNVYVGALMYGIDQNVFRGKAPWTLHRRLADHETIKRAVENEPIVYPRADNTLIFDRDSSLYLSGTMHEEDQPVHLILKDAKTPIEVNFAKYAGLEERYCPAAVYKFFPDVNENLRLHINAVNCLHCKACDIKDPAQNIIWVVPEGGGGPHYFDM